MVTCFERKYNILKEDIHCTGKEAFAGKARVCFNTYVCMYIHYYVIHTGLPACLHHFQLNEHNASSPTYIQSEFKYPNT